MSAKLPEALTKLQAWARACKSPLLDRKPFLDRPVLVKLECFFCGCASSWWYADVPLNAICAFTHHNFFTSGKSWRQIIYPHDDKNGLTCNGWSPTLFPYFDTEIKDSYFSEYASHCNGTWRFLAIGGAVTITNGVHRTVGAYIYRAATQPNHPNIRKAWVRRCNLIPSVKKFLTDRDFRSAVFISDSAIVTCRGLCAQMLARKHDGSFTTPNVIGFVVEALKGDWHRVPPEVLTLLLDDSWLQDAERAPNYGG